jgi:hypothetical protein
VTQLLDHQRRRVLIDHLVDRRHDAELHQFLDHHARLDGHLLGEIANGYHVGDLYLVDFLLRGHLEAVLAMLLVGRLDLATTTATARHARLRRPRDQTGTGCDRGACREPRNTRRLELDRGCSSCAGLPLRRCGRRVQALGTASLPHRHPARRARAAASARSLRSSSALRAAIAASRAARGFLFFLLATRRSALAQNLRIEVLLVLLLDPARAPVPLGRGTVQAPARAPVFRRAAPALLVGTAVSSTSGVSSAGCLAGSSSRASRRCASCAPRRSPSCARGNPVRSVLTVLRFSVIFFGAAVLRRGCASGKPAASACPRRTPALRPHCAAGPRPSSATAAVRRSAYRFCQLLYCYLRHCAFSLMPVWFAYRVRNAVGGQALDSSSNHGARAVMINSPARSSVIPSISIKVIDALLGEVFHRDHAAARQG